MRKEVTNSNYNIQGVVLLCPYFWGSKSIGEEGKDPLKKVLVDIGWKFVMGWNSNMTLDDPRVNPIVEGAPSLVGLKGKKALVIVADEDYLRFRGKAYYEELVKSSWGGKPELKVYDGVGHVFFLGHLDSKESKDLLASLAAFFN